MIDSASSALENGLVPAQPTEAPVDVKELQRDNEKLRGYIVDVSKKQYKEHGLSVETGIPQFLLHMGQVAAISREIVLQSNLPVVQKNKIAEDAERLGLVHDMGRIDDIGTYDTPKYNGNLHTNNGAQRLIDLGFEQKYVDITLDHHRWGLGTEGKNRPDFVALAKEKGVGAVIEHYEKEYGLPGLACVLADVSKAYPHLDNKDLDPAERQAPVITEVTKEAGEALINRQIHDRKAFTEGSPRHVAEQLGLSFALAAVEHLKTKYGVDYQRAISNAKYGWEASERTYLQKLWDEKYFDHYANTAVEPTKTTIPAPDLVC